MVPWHIPIGSRSAGWTWMDMEVVTSRVGKRQYEAMAAHEADRWTACSPALGVGRAARRTMYRVWHVWLCSRPSHGRAPAMTCRWQNHRLRCDQAARPHLARHGAVQTDRYCAGASGGGGETGWSETRGGRCQELGDSCPAPAGRLGAWSRCLVQLLWRPALLRAGFLLLPPPSPKTPDAWASSGARTCPPPPCTYMAWISVQVRAAARLRMHI